MKRSLTFLLIFILSSALAQNRVARARLGNLGAPPAIELPDLGFAQGFLPSSLANAKHVNIKISKTRPSGFGAVDGNTGFTGEGERIEFTARGAFSDNSGASTNGIRGGFDFPSTGGSTISAGNSAFGISANANIEGVLGGFSQHAGTNDNSKEIRGGFGFSSQDNNSGNNNGNNNEVRGGFGFSSQDNLSGNTGFGFTSNAGSNNAASNGNLDTGVTLDSFEFFDKNLHEPGLHLTPYPIIPANISHQQPNSQHQNEFTGDFQRPFTTLPLTSIPQPFNHNQEAFSGPTATRAPSTTTTSTRTTTTTTSRPFEISAHITPVPAVNDLIQQRQPFVNNFPPPPPNVNQLSVNVPQVPILSGPSFEEVVEQEWNEFTSRFNKVYADQNEARFRREVFIENRAKIMRFNMEYAEGRRNFVHKINEFADMLVHEFNNNFNGFNRSRREPDVPLKPASTFVPSANVVFPDSVDWRMVGAVSPVKSQGKCAGCYAFAAAGALEGHTFRKTGQLIEVSAQNLIDCTQPYGNNGCSGGLMDPAFEYVRDNNGVDSDRSYPFEGVNGQCRFKRQDVVATCTGFVDIGENDEKGLEIALATLGPVTAAIDASKETFQFYSEGIYDDPACGNTPEQMNHAVLIIGYGQEPDGRKYWLVKNSYGPNWGIGGYIKIAKENNNQCGIAIQASYPLV